MNHPRKIILIESKQVLWISDFLWTHPNKAMTALCFFEEDGNRMKVDSFNFILYHEKGFFQNPSDWQYQTYFANGEYPCFLIRKEI